MFSLNRKNVVRGLIEDVLKLKVVDLQDLNAADATQKW